jgi:hypothetical protein
MTVVKMSTWSKLERMGYILRSTELKNKIQGLGAVETMDLPTGGTLNQPKTLPTMLGFPIRWGGVQAKSQDPRSIEPLLSCTVGPKAQQEHIIKGIRQELINIVHTPRLLEHGGLGWGVVVGNRNNAPVFPVWGTHAQLSRKSCEGSCYDLLHNTHPHIYTQTHTHTRTMHAQENLSRIDVEHGLRTKDAPKTFPL